MSKKGRRVLVQDGNVDKALRKFKKKIMESGLLEEVRGRQEFVKPTVRRKVAQGKARHRWKKHLSSQQLPKKLY
jgi:small subunit ribosomal protein S21